MRAARALLQDHATARPAGERGGVVAVVSSTRIEQYPYDDED